MRGVQCTDSWMALREISRQATVAEREAAKSSEVTGHTRKRTGLETAQESLKLDSFLPFFAALTFQRCDYEASEQD